MELGSISISKIVFHQIFDRTIEGAQVAPKLSTEITVFDGLAMKAFVGRVTQSLGTNSKAIEVEIDDSTLSKVPDTVDGMIGESPDVFVVRTQELAIELAKAQKKTTSGGVLAVFEGVYGVNEKRFIGLIKAEIHTGYEKIIDKNTEEVGLKFVEEMLLTPASKLYKTAGFFEIATEENPISDLPIKDRWTVMVSDHQSKTKGAAQFFLNDFLGCKMLASNARTTASYFKNTRKYIDKLDLSPAEKTDIKNALKVYLSVDNSEEVVPAEFAEKYLSDEHQDEYLSMLREEGIPTTAFFKDVSDIKGDLKTSQIRTSKSIKISGPPQVFDQLVSVEEIPMDGEESGDKVWTRVVIRDKIAP